jgi:hypothetical protein
MLLDIKIEHAHTLLDFFDSLAPQAYIPWLA